MFDLLWVRFVVQTQTAPVSRERQREFEAELENRIGFGGLQAIIRRFVRW